MKEKKPTSTEALTQTLQAMHQSGCFTLADVVEGMFHFQSTEISSSVILLICHSVSNFWFPENTINYLSMPLLLLIFFQFLKKDGVVTFRSTVMKRKLSASS